MASSLSTRRAFSVTMRAWLATRPAAQLTACGPDHEGERQQQGTAEEQSVPKLEPSGGHHDGSNAQPGQRSHEGGQAPTRAGRMSC